MMNDYKFADVLELIERSVELLNVENSREMENELLLRTVTRYAKDPRNTNIEDMAKGLIVAKCYFVEFMREVFEKYPDSVHNIDGYIPIASSDFLELLFAASMTNDVIVHNKLYPDIDTISIVVNMVKSDYFLLPYTELMLKLLNGTVVDDMISMTREKVPNHY